MVYDSFGRNVAEYSGSTLERENIYRGGALLAVYEPAASAFRYVLTDVQGSARAVLNSSGAVIARHDYLPFGEEIGAGIGLRTTGQGFGATDPNRQKYGLTERDETTGLDHTWWRKYENRSGRWTSPDPYGGSMLVSNPQSHNRYAYANDPVNLIDPTGLSCTFNINVSGVSGQELTDLQNEITRIFASGGHSVVFNNPGQANGGSMNLTVTDSYPPEVQSFITDQGAQIRNTPGVAPPNTGNAYVNHSVAGNALLLSGNPYAARASIGTVEGRIAAHEVVQHGFLNIWSEGLREDVTRSRVPVSTLVATSTSRFDMSGYTAAELDKLCQPPPPNPLPEILHGAGRGAHPILFGFGGYSPWWYVFQHLAWVDSIPVGGGQAGDEGPIQPKPRTPPKLR